MQTKPRNKSNADLLDEARRAHALTTEQAAAYLGLSPNTLHRWRWSGHGPRYRKLGRSVRYMRADLDAWTDDCAQANTSEQATA